MKVWQWEGVLLWSLLCSFNGDVKCLAPRHWQWKCCLLHPLDTEATFAVLGHNPKICHLLYHISPGSLTKKNNTCTVFRGRERMREYGGGGGGGTKRERHLIIYALSCERQQKSVRVWEKKKRRGERDLESDCVCVRETFLWPSASQKAPSD